MTGFADKAFSTEGCRKSAPEQRRGWLIFPCAGAFGSFGPKRTIKKDLKKNTTERLRLRTAVEYNRERKRVSKALNLPLCHVQPNSAGVIETFSFPSFLKTNHLSWRTNARIKTYYQQGNSLQNIKAECKWRNIRLLFLQINSTSTWGHQAQPVPG